MGQNKYSVDIIVPLYNAEDYILDLHSSFLKQKEVSLGEIVYILTESSDNTEQILRDNHIFFKKIKRDEFSHSTVRENAAYSSRADIVTFVTQDVVIESEFWLKNLITPILLGNCEATYSRQISKYNNIEKYTREKNYPDVSFITTKSDISSKGLKTFFFSDASSAILRAKFVELNGYDGKKLPTNEDMYFAYKLIMSGGKIGYVSDSVVYHSHNFSLKEIYERYKLTGIFFKQNSYLDKFGTNKSGGGLAKYILKRAICEKNIKVLIRYPFDMAARLLGMKVGKHSA
ncbi:MAG: glycosyltransferase family 2 protein [Bacilli bacterium]|nr:glycosyltransferase family 2 protein [Bacilli bacterium]